MSAKMLQCLYIFMKLLRVAFVKMRLIEVYRELKVYARS